MIEQLNHHCMNYSNPTILDGKTGGVSLPFQIELIAFSKFFSIDGRERARYGGRMKIE